MNKQSKNFSNKTITNMSNEEFDSLVEQFIERAEERVTLPTFLQVMADVAAQRKQHEVELTGRVVNGEIIFDTLAPLPVGKNTLYVGDTKVTLRLRVDSNDQRSMIP